MLARRLCRRRRRRPAAGPSDLADADPGDCIVVDMAVSSEKIALLTELADEFNDSDRPRSTAGASSSARAAWRPATPPTLIAEGLAEPSVNGEPPVIWSPAASGVGRHRQRASRAELAPAGTPFMLTPLVIAMPQPMAEALGWPDEPIGFADLPRLANNPEGWGSVGHPEWGPFRLGKTNPNYSTSGLNFTIAEYYAATGKTAGLTLEDLARPAAVEFATHIESAVVHYGDITMTFLNNWFAADAAGTALTYASAVAVEEKSVIDYNLGNPDGVLSPGEEPRVPREPLVAIYPEEGTLFSDSPFIVLDTEWVDDDEKAAAALFEEFVQLPENQQKVMEFGFRPNNPAVPLADPIVAANGVDPTQPTAELGVPAPEVLIGILESWAELRKDARVLLVLDISGSMGETAAATGGPSSTSPGGGDQRARPVQGQRRGRAVGVQHRPRRRRPERPRPRAARPDRRPARPARGADRRAVPTNGTPLYKVAQKAYESMVAGYDPTKINAIVLLTDGVNDDGDPADDDEQFAELIETLQVGQRGIERAAGAAVHDLLRRRRRHDRAAGDQPGDERGDLQRQQPGDHRAGVHRRDQQLLTWRGARSAIGSSRRGWRGRSCRRSASCCSAPAPPPRSSSGCRSRPRPASGRWRGAVACSPPYRATAVGAGRAGEPQRAVAHLRRAGRGRQAALRPGRRVGRGGAAAGAPAAAVGAPRRRHRRVVADRPPRPRAGRRDRQDRHRVGG